MERNGSKDRKSEHKREGFDSDKERSNDEMDIPEFSTGKKEIPKRETPSTTDAKTEMFPHPLESNNPQHEEVNIKSAHRKRHASASDITQLKKSKTSPVTAPALSEVNIPSGHRKRHASHSDDTSPKKLVPALVTAPARSEDNAVRGHRKRCAPTLEVTESKKPALPWVPDPAEEDSSDAKKSLQCQFENLHIGQSGKDAMLQGAIPRPLSKMLVYRERSGYVNAQAGFHVRLEDASGRSGLGVPGGSRQSVPLITIDEPEESYARIKLLYNNEIPYVEERLAPIRPIIEAIPVYLESVQRARRAITPQFQYSRRVVDKYVLKLEYLCKSLKKYMTHIENEMKDCIRTAGILNYIYTANNASARPTNLTRRKLWRALDEALECMLLFVKNIRKQAGEYHISREIINEELPMAAK